MIVKSVNNEVFSDYSNVAEQGTAKFISTSLPPSGWLFYLYQNVRSKCVLFEIFVVVVMAQEIGRYQLQQHSSLGTVVESHMSLMKIKEQMYRVKGNRARFLKGT